MPYNSETGQYERRVTTILDETPDGDTVNSAVAVKIDAAVDDGPTDLNHHKVQGGHYPATSTATSSRYLHQSPAGVVSWRDGVPADQAAQVDASNVTDGAAWRTAIGAEAAGAGVAAVTTHNADASSHGQIQVQGAASWSAEVAPYPINAQVYHNDKQWIALRANSVEPVEGADWTEFSVEKYDVGEFYYFRHPILKPGFAPLNGGLISGAYQGKDITEYPIWEYLQTADGQLLLKTEAEWQAMTTAIWHTLADGTTVGWEGIGGAPFYVQDLGAGTLRMPDVRGMYAEAAGFDSLGVGGVHGDTGRQIYGSFGSIYVYPGPSSSGALYPTAANNAAMDGATVASRLRTINIDSGLITPIGPAFAPRRWGALACCYLGRPA
jgi:hypothetical protein